MSCRQFLTILFSAIALFLGGTACAQTAKHPYGLGEDNLLSERYASKVQDLVLKALELVGINYRRGGAHPDVGLDCSGFVQFVFKDAAGESLPRTAREQSKAGQIVDKSELKPGDLVFFNTMRRTFSHVGIYLGGDHFVHAPRTGKKIRVDDMSRSYWVKRYNGARRIVER